MIALLVALAPLLLQLGMFVIKYFITSAANDAQHKVDMTNFWKAIDAARAVMLQQAHDDSAQAKDVETRIDADPKPVTTKPPVSVPAKPVNVEDQIDSDLHPNTLL